MKADPAPPEPAKPLFDTPVDVEHEDIHAEDPEPTGADTRTPEPVAVEVVEEKGNGNGHEPTAIEKRPTAPFDLDPAVFKAALDRRKANRTALLEWIAEELREGVDFDKIHVVSKNKCQLGKRCKDPYHFSKPTLLKPGAEKISSMLGLTAVYPNAVEYEQKALRGEPINVIMLRCQLVSGSGQIVAEGIGSRVVDPSDGIHALNKAMKMAEKSGKIDATLQLGLSDTYTQDIEDMGLDREEPASGSGNPYASGREEPQAPPPTGPTKDIGKFRRLEMVCTGDGRSPESFGCGSPLIERQTKDNKTQVTCELSYRAYVKDPWAVDQLEKVKAAKPRVTHSFKVS